MSYVTKENTQDIYPLSPTQKGMLFHSLYDETSPVYFEQLAFTINGPLDVAAFKSSWDHMIAGNAILRTVFKWANVKEPVQVVLKNLPVDFNIHDITGMPPERQHEFIDSFMQQDKKRPFALDMGPLIRLNLFKLSGESHRFVWSYHHILLDGWCLSIVVKDLFEAYLNIASGKQPSRPARRAYKDYIAWYLKQDKEASTSFWKSLLKDFDSPTQLPFTSKVSHAQGATEEELVFSRETTGKVQELAKSERVTQSSIIQAVWALLLSFYSGNDDVVFGVTVSGRPADLKGCDETLGLFINTLPARIKISGDSTVSGLLQQMQKMSLAIRDYEYSFLPDVKACSAVAKSTDLFDSIVVFENYPLDSMATGTGSNFGISDIKASEMTNFPITIIVAPGDRIGIKIVYQHSMFDQATIKRMLGHMGMIVDSFLNNPSGRLNDIEIMTPDEKQTVLGKFNDTARDYPLDKCVYQLIEEQAEKTPDAVAVTFEDDKLTYSQLNAKANRLARWLRENGVRREVMVALMLERSLEMEIALLGVMKSGGAYVPVGTDYPDARVDYILEDTQCPVVITQEKFRYRFEGRGVKVLPLDTGFDALGGYDTSNPEPLSRPENLAYVLYTSGSTGIPKGVACIHIGLTNRLVWMQEEYRLTEKDIVLQKTPYTFDVSGWEFFWPMMYGACLHFIKPEGHKDPLHMIDVISQRKITTMHFVPSMLGGFLQVVDDDNKKQLDSLRQVICSGEALLGEHRDVFFRYLNTAELINLYGPTEASIDVTYYNCNRSDASPIVPIGKPVANTQIFILNKSMKPVPVGINGEIYLAGVQLARGYVNKPEKTAEAFVHNPVSPDGRLYKTGDLGRWQKDGNIEYLGRIDHQVKIRGNRIELGEVESALSRFARIEACVVIDRNDPSTGKYLVGYYVADRDIPVGELRAFLTDNLPEYMVPSRFMRLEEMPLSPNGKVDRKALPEVENYIPETGGNYVAPTNDIEIALAQVWQEVLGIGRVGIKDNFFDLGGDSIISLQVVGRMKKRGLAIRPKDIFDFQTIEELALVVKKTAAGKAEQGPVEGESPLTPVQEWFFALDLHNRNHFNQSLIFKSLIKLDANALRKSLQAVIDHHDALRSRFSGSSQVFTGIGEAVCFAASKVKNEDELSAEINRLQASFDIGNGPVFGAGLYDMNGTDYIAVAAHHLVVDGVSWRIILEDLFSAYGAVISGAQIALPEKTTSFKKWAEDLKGYSAKKDFADEITYWNENLPQAKSGIPTDSENGLNVASSSQIEGFELSGENTGLLLKDANRAFNTEVGDLMLAALASSLINFSGDDKLCLDMEGHGREDVIEGVDLSRTVGWFTTIYPVSLAGTAGMDLGDRIKNLKEKMRSIPAKGFNYGVLKYLGGGAVPNIEAPILFNYLGQVNTAEISGSMAMVSNLKIAPSDPLNKRSHLLDISSRAEDGRLKTEISYSTNVFRKETVKRLAGLYKAALEEVIAFCLSVDHEIYTPSDFGLSEVSQDQLDQLIDDIKDL